MSAFLRSILPILGLALALALSACDSSGDAVTPGDVAGEYVFSDFRFIPESTLLPAANLLDTLVAENTRLQLFSSGRFTLLYQFRGANPEFIGGNFDVNRERVRIIGREDEEPFYRRLLLPPEFILQRAEPEGFSATIPRTVNLEAFSSRYKGLRSVDGKVILRLVRR